MYLAGYRVECLLKARLMEMHGARDLAELEKMLTQRSGEQVDLKTHSIEYLFGFAPAARDRLVGKALRAFQRCNTWRVAWRYDPSQGTEKDCESFLEAAETLRGFVENSL
jgi:hypothetical protein